MSANRRYEYRLRWQRLGRAPTTRIMQTDCGAVAKAERMLVLDENKHDDSEYGRSFADMPDLVWMDLESRPVGTWTKVRDFDVPEPDHESADPPDDRVEADAWQPW